MKNLFLNPERTLARKAKEIRLAHQMEKSFSKEEILSLYVSNIEWGRGVYGIKEASQYYLKKYPNQLSRNESIFLGLITPEPRYFDHAFHELKAFSKEFRTRYYQTAMMLDLLAPDGERALGVKTLKGRIMHLEFHDRFLTLESTEQSELIAKAHKRFRDLFHQYVID